jgi:hypothetical protein
MTARTCVWLEPNQELAIQSDVSAQQARRHRAVAVRARGARLNTLTPVFLMAMLALAPGVGAQGSGKGFLFHKPVGSFAFRGGYAVANASSDVFNDATTQLTLNKGDFSGFNFGGDISYSMGDRWDVLFDAEAATSSKSSEFRNFIDTDNKPIEQTTKFQRVPLTLGIKYYLTSRGRSVSQFAYVPTKWAPYVSVGGGAMYYYLQQKGDFVDFQTRDVFNTTLESSGWAPMGQGAAGVEYSLGPWLALTGEARYVWAKATLDPSAFEGYDKIDLTGFTGTAGIRVRF